MGEPVQAMMEQAHLNSLRSDPSFAWFLGIVNKDLEDATRHALARNPPEHREFLVGRAGAFGDVLSILPRAAARVKRDLEGSA